MGTSRQSPEHGAGKTQELRERLKLDVLTDA